MEQNQPRKSTMAPPTQKVIKRLSKEIEEECYSNRNEHRGICLILEHDIFAPNLQLRFDLLFSQKRERWAIFTYVNSYFTVKELAQMWIWELRTNVLQIWVSKCISTEICAILMWQIYLSSWLLRSTIGRASLHFKLVFEALYH